MTSTIPNDQKYQALLNSAPDAIVIVDGEGTIGIANEQAEKVFGYAKSELLGQPVEMLVPEMKRSRHVEDRLRYGTNPYIRPMESRLALTALRKDGSEFPVEISLSLLETDEGQLVTSIIRDVTERKRSEDSLRESEQRFRDFVEETDDLVVRVDNKGVLIYANRTAEKMFGLTPEQCAGMPLFDFIHPADWEETYEALMKTTARPKETGLENRVVSKDGSERNVLWTVNQRRDSEGNLTSVTAIARDITERKRARVAVQRLQTERNEAKLRKAVLRHTIAAQEEERRRIARELHDETGQTLAGILLALGRIKRSGNIDQIKIEAQQLSEAVHRSLDELRSLASRLRPTALDDLGLKPALEQLVEDAPRNDQCTIQFKSSDMDIRLDSAAETAIYRIVQEALTNAAKYAAATEIGVSVAYEDNVLVAIVSDNGVGFDLETVGHSSLGLVGMKERAGLVEGQLEIESSPGKGTVVVLRIPVGE